MLAGSIFLFSKPQQRVATPTTPTPSLPLPVSVLSTLAPLPEVIDPAVPLREEPADLERITRENASQLELLGQVGEGVLNADFDLSPDGKTIAISSGGGVILADAGTMERTGFIPILGGARELDISPDGSKLAVNHYQRSEETVSAEGAGTSLLYESLLSIFELESKELITRIRLREGGCAGTSAERPVFTGDGKFVAISGFTPRNLPDGGGALCLYSASDGSLARIFQPRDAFGNLIVVDRNKDLLYAIRYDDDVRSDAKSLVALDLHNGAMVQEIPLDIGPVEHLFLPEDGQRILVGSLSRIGWLNLDDKSWKELTIPGLEKEELVQTAVNANGSRIAFVAKFEQGHLYLLDGDAGSLLWGPLASKLYPAFDGRELRQLALETSKLIISPDGQSLYQLHPGKTLRKISLADGSVLGSLGGQSEAHVYAVNLDATRLAFGGYFDHTARVWSIKENRELFALRGHNGIVRGITYSPDGRMIATASEDGKLNLWNAETGVLLHSLQANEGAAWAVDFSADGKLLASCGDDAQLRIWDGQTGALLKTLAIGGSGQSHRILHFLPGDSSVLIASYCLREENCAVDSTKGELVKLDLNSGQILAQAAVVAFGLEISDDGQFIGTVSLNYGWCFGDPFTAPGAMTCMPNNYTGNGVSPDGSLFATTNGQKLQVYDALSKALLAEKLPGIGYGWTRVSPDQKTIWVSGYRLQFWGIPEK